MEWKEGMEITEETSNGYGRITWIRGLVVDVNK